MPKKSRTKRCVMAVTNDMVTDQRVHRAASTLAADGWQVTVVCRRLPHSGLPRRVRSDERQPYSIIRMRLLFNRKAFFYAEFNIRLLFRLLFMQASLVYANDTDTLPACMVAAKLRGRRLFFDAHEMFPEVPELLHRPAVKRVWRKIEDMTFPHLAACCTVSQSIADAYHERYGINMAVVRNLPFRYEKIKSEAKKVENGQAVSTLLYQGAVNLGRGIELVIDAMRWLPDCRLVVAGTGDVLEALKQRASETQYGDRIAFLGRVKPDDLRRLTPSATMGLCLLYDLGLNYRYSFPNRVGDYAQSGVPILATDFPELHAVVTRYGIGTLVDPACKEPRQLAEIIQRALSEWAAMPQEERASRFDKAAADLCWEKERSRLLEAIR